jgi:hypothetical protein
MLSFVSDLASNACECARTCQHLCRDVGAFRKVIRDVGERRPYRHKNSINAQGSIVGVDPVPEEDNEQSYEDDEEREEEAEGRTALYGVWYVQSRADDAVCSDQKRCQEVSESYDADS